MARSFTPTLTIAERTGQKRKLVLSSQAMPFRPQAFPCATVMNVTGHQGNPDTTVQMFRPSYEPIRFKGSWKDWWLTKGQATLDGAPITSVEPLVRAIKSLWLAGQEMDLVWNAEAFRVHMSGFVPTYDFADVCNWEMTFQVVGAGLTVAQAGFVPAFDAATTAKSLLASISSYVGKAQAALRKVQALRAQVTAYLDRIDLLRAQIENTITTATDVVLTPVTLASRLIQTVTDLTQVYAAIQRAGDQCNASVAAFNGSASEMVRAYTGRAELTAASRAAQSEARKIIFAARRQITPRVLRVVVAKEELDLRTVAMEVYGSQNQWKQIAQYNGLPGMTAPAGRQILVPELAPA